MDDLNLLRYPNMHFIHLVITNKLHTYFNANQRPIKLKICMMLILGDLSRNKSQRITLYFYEYNFSVKTTTV